MTEEIVRSEGLEHVLDVVSEGISAALDNKPKFSCCCCSLMFSGLLGGALYLTNAYLNPPQVSPIESVAPVQSVDYSRPERE
ncbi:hypothetical protein J4219_01555 [Candidatus Woesearchaeota archaeon]|nr:hypothetical protein [Candidatus Woesearchaeota archaeon]